MLALQLNTLDDENTSPLKEEFLYFNCMYNQSLQGFQDIHTMDILSCNSKSYENCYDGGRERGCTKYYTLSNFVP